VIEEMLAALGTSFLFPAQKVARVEASTEMLRILHDPEEDLFKGIATGAESWFQYACPSAKMFAQLPSDVIPRTRQVTGTKQTMMTIFFTGCKLRALDILPKENKSN
jgi:hypothetical protein